MGNTVASTEQHQPGTYRSMMPTCQESLHELDKMEMNIDLATGQLLRDTQIIFDWDDTLMCSSEVKMRRKPDSDGICQLEHAVEAILRKALALGTTTIVTNANLGWVHATADQYMPSVVPLLKYIEIVSARQNYEHEWPNDPNAWKREAFRDIVCCSEKNCMCAWPFCSAEPAKSSASSDNFPVNLVVLGDSTAEIQAGKSAVEARGDDESIVKTIKFKDAPSLEELLGQLSTVHQHLEKIVSEEKSVSKHLVHSNLFGWNVCDTNKSSLLDFLACKMNRDCDRT